MKRVIIESPYRGHGEREVKANVDYARECLLDSLKREEAPIASHLLYPQVLDDNNADDRRMGMDAGWEWIVVSNLLAVYTDRGISQGMKGAIGKAGKYGVEVEYRQLYATGEEGEKNVKAQQDVLRPCP